MMGLWMLLLLHVHLGNAPWTEVVCVSLPAPSNVSISSFNMEHTLSFLPGLDTPSDTHFTVHILTFRKNLWRPVAACLSLIAGQTCNLTRAFKDPFGHYKARVQAFTVTQTSNWTVSRRFQPLSDTVLGPPDVSVSGCGNCLLLKLRVPPSRSLQQLHDFYRGVVFHVERTRDGAQFVLSLPYKEENVIPYLQPGVEYCVTATVKSPFNSNAVSTKPHCAFTSPPPSRTTLYVILSLLALFCVLLFLLIGLVLGGHLSVALLRRCPTRTLSYILHRCQNGGGASVELSGQISGPQRHKESSAERLLTDLRPVHPPRSSDEKDYGEEDYGEEGYGEAVESNVGSVEEGQDED